MEPTAMREFTTGATRNTDDNKLDYEGFLSPLVLERYAQYLHKHRLQADGKIRESDNWQKGIPQSVYMKSLWRHFMDVWKQFRGYKGEEDMDDSLCAVLFNASGLLHERLRAQVKRQMTLQELKNRYPDMFITPDNSHPEVKL